MTEISNYKKQYILLKLGVGLMKISTKGRYGLEALMMICLESGQTHISLKKIAESCNISEAYILQIFLVLRRAGIVDSIRGAQGGYTLSKAPDQIKVAEVLNALEGPLSPVACILDDIKNPCNRSERCATRLLWAKVADSLNEIAASITLADLVRQYLAMNSYNVETEDYCI